MSGTTTPTTAEPPPLDDRDTEPRTPMKRLGSTRKLAAFNNIRLQLCEQTRVLEARAEATAGVAGELHDYCRRRADLEHEYSRALDKLARAAIQRHKDQKHKREQWSLTGAYACWQAALDNTRALSRDHAALADLYGGQLSSRLQRAADDALRLHRKCRDIVQERHEEVGAALAEAAVAGKAHGAAAGEWRAAALKLRHAHERAQLAAADPPRTKKLKALDKELEKRRTRYSEARARALRARADYVLSLEAANATLQRYYLDDIADIMLCMEVGFEAVVGRVVRCAGGAEGARAQALCAAAGALLGAADALDAVADRTRFVDAHAAAFALPRPLPYQGTPPDQQDTEMCELVAGATAEEDAGTAGVAAELAQRLQQLEAGARALRAECRENAKTLDAAEAELVKLMEGSEEQWDVSAAFGVGAAPPSAPADDAAADASRRDQEDYYLAKFRAYVSCAGRLARLESKASGARARLGRPAPGSPPPSPPRRARLRRGQFAAPLDERALPRVLTECVRVIAIYGLRHQGIFRVSGSQVEMQALRAAFERGEDPLAHVRDASDINSVCGLLKLYLRELRPPLLPPALQERLLRLAALPDDAEFAARMRELIASLSTPAMLVLRYLFAFLAHLTEHSEHNMMDAWNLAICVGPTLVAAWGEGGAQVTAQNLANELVKRTILRHEECFPQDVAPSTLYVRYPEAPPDGEPVAEPESGERPAASDASGARDDLSLYDDDDIDDEEESDECESGEWCDRDSVGARSGAGDAGAAACASGEGRADSQVRPPPSASTVTSAVASASASAHAAPPPPPCRRLAESTPDLVLDLPARGSPPARPAPPTAAAAAPPAPAPGAPAPPLTDTADTFLHNRDTLKKRPTHKQICPESDTESRDACEESQNSAEASGEATSEASGERAEGSPVPARNTARVAAKFAELTLTGGSLKPALAAKPALLRRPTPHPQHVRAAPSHPAPAPAVDPDTAH